MVLRITDLACARGLPVLEGVTFTLAAGGADPARAQRVGKTTLLRTIAGLQPALSGRIDAPAEGVAYAAHADGIKPTLTVAENLGFWAAVYGAQDVAGAMAALNLVALADRPAQNLSAGQKRRAALARLAVAGRKVWVLDEPTVSLDAASVALFAALVRAHLGGGGAALMATHIDLGLPEAAVLDLGSHRARIGAMSGFDDAFGAGIA